MMAGEVEWWSMDYGLWTMDYGLRRCFFFMSSYEALGFLFFFFCKSYPFVLSRRLADDGDHSIASAASLYNVFVLLMVFTFVLLEGL